jgi:hypothetical protein
VSGIYKAVVAAEAALSGDGSLAEALSGTDPRQIIKDVGVAAAALQTTLQDLAAEVDDRLTRGGPLDLVQALHLVRAAADEAFRVTFDIAWTFGQIAQGGIGLADQRAAINSVVPSALTAIRDLRSALGELKMRVAPPRAARRRRTEIRADLDRDAG